MLLFQKVLSKYDLSYWKISNKLTLNKIFTCFVLIAKLIKIQKARVKVVLKNLIKKKRFEISLRRL